MERRSPRPINQVDGRGLVFRVVLRMHMLTRPVDIDRRIGEFRRAGTAAHRLDDGPHRRILRFREAR